MPFSTDPSKPSYGGSSNRPKSGAAAAKENRKKKPKKKRDWKELFFKTKSMPYRFGGDKSKR